MSKKRKRRTYKEVKEYIESFNYVLLSPENEITDHKGFVQAKTVFTVKCDNNHIYNTTFDVFLRSKCRVCSRVIGANKKRHSHSYISDFFSKYGYTLISHYEHMDIPLDTICPRGHKWSVSYGNFKSGYRCPICNKIDADNDKLVNLKRKIENKGWKMLDFKRSESHFSKSLVSLQCEKGHIFTKNVKNLNSRGCPICHGKEKKTIEEVTFVFNSNGYEIIEGDTYENNHSRFTLMCPNGHSWETSYANFQQGGRCPHCDKKGFSNGELQIKHFLDNHNIEHFYEYSFKDCKYRILLRFDFYIPSLNLVIEFDGEQHLRPIKYFGGEKTYKKIKERDSIKNSYCIENNIRLLRIPYNKLKDIDKILCNELIQIQGESSTTIP